MRRLAYISGTGGVRVEMSGPSTYAGTASGIRGREWSYTLGHMSLTGVTRTARECSLPVAFTDMGEADLLRRVADRDMANGTPGALQFGEWTQRAYLASSQPDTINRAWVEADIKAVLLDGVWRRGHTVSFEPLTASSGDGEFLDLPYDLPYDLGVPSTRKYFDGSEWGGTPLKFEIYGPCVNPSIRIDGNWYKVDATVMDGGYLVIDPIACPRSVVMVNADGSTVDMFSKAHRGEGLGSGEYVFQPASPGTHEVDWDRSFGFDLTWYEEEGEPPWSR